MDIEDLAPRPDRPLKALAKEDLGGLSIDELAGRIEALKAEMQRVEHALGQKKLSLSAADSIFRKA
jgi:uncharacterized small protein (DUF1192 family)